MYTDVVASEKCHQEKRKTVNGEDIIFAMTSLGFENYAEVLKIYLAKYRQNNKEAPVTGSGKRKGSTGEGMDDDDILEEEEEDANE